MLLKEGGGNFKVLAVMIWLLLYLKKGNFNKNNI